MGRPKIYKINENCFNKINSHTAAYMLGYIYADAHVGERVIEFNIKADDVELLENIKRFFDSTHPINTKGLYAHYSVCSTKIATVLRNKWGVPKNKNNSLSLPKISEQFLNSFLLGFFDGDGSIGFYKDFRISISGGFNVLSEIKKTLDEKFNINMHLRHRYEIDNKNSWMLEQHGNIKTKKILNWLYSKYKKPLKRKKDKYLILKKLKSKILEEKTVKELWDLKNKGLCAREIANALKLKLSTVKSRIQRSKNKFTKGKSVV